MKEADSQLNHIKNESDKMTPEDRVSYTMELQEDVAARVEIIKKAIATEAELLPQGILFSFTKYFNTSKWVYRKGSTDKGSTDKG
jgi:hypothetical protein